MLKGPAVTRRYATDTGRINSIIEYLKVRRVRWPSQAPGIITLTFTA
jgi:hypothetical protein